MSSESLDAEALFKRHAAFVHRFLIRLGAPAADVEDLVQEVFLVAHTHGGFVAGAAKPTTWLAQIAVNLVANTRRKAQRRAPAEDVSLSGLPSPGDPQARIAAGQSLTRVQEALEALDIDHRVVFVLFEIEREPCDEIAAGLGIPIGTVYSRLHKARLLFRDEFQRVAGTPAIAQLRRAQ